MTIDLTTAANPGFFDTSGIGSLDFTPLGGTDATTGQTSPMSVPDNSTLLTILFNDFQPGEFFSFQIDVDGINPMGGGIGNAIARSLQDDNEMLGTSASVMFTGADIQPTVLQGPIDQLAAFNVGPLNFNLAAFATLQGDAAPVPEPGAMLVWLMVGAVVSVVAMRRRLAARS